MSYEFVPLSKDTEEDSKPYSFVPLESIKETPKVEPTPTTDAMGADLGSAIMEAATPKRTSVLEGTTLPEQAPLIERRGAPVSEEKFAELKRRYDAATPKERQALTQSKGAEGSVFQTIDSQYREFESKATPTLRIFDTRREARRDAYISQGLNAESADALAAREAAAGQNPQRLAQAKPSTFDFETKREYARPKSELAFGETEGGDQFARVVKPTGIEELGAAAKAIGGKVTNQFKSAAAGAWQLIGDAAELAGDVAGSKQLSDIGARLSGGNAVAQREAQGRLEAIGENPNAALNFIEAGVSGAINNFAPYLVNPALGVTAAVGQVFAEEYGNGKAAGQSMDQALMRASALSAAEWIGERASLPAPFLKGFRDLVKGVPADQVMPAFARYLAKENLAEQVTTGMQFGTDKWAPFGLKPEATLDDYLKAVGDTFYQTTAQTLVMGGAGRVAAPIARKLEERNPERMIANEIDRAVQGTEFVEPADAIARRLLDVQSYDENIIAPTRTANLDVAREALGQATNVDDAAAAAGVMSGSMDELLVPTQAVTTPLPVEPQLTNEPLPEITGTEPTLTGELLANTTPGAVALPPVNPQVEQQFGLDKLRMQAPRPQRIQGEPVANLTDDQLTKIASDESVPAITRRSATVELTARQAEQAATQAPIEAGVAPTPAQPLETAPAPAVTQMAPAVTPEAPSVPPAAQVVPAQVPGAITYTQAEVGQLRLGDRRKLAREYDLTENPDGSITYTPKSAAPAAAPTAGAAPVAETFVAVPATAPGAQAVSDATAQAVAGVADATRARAAAQAALDSWAASSGVTAPRLNAPAPELETAVGDIATALGSQFGGHVVAFNDPSPSAPNGLAIGGTAFVNTATDVNVMRTSLHEFKHTVEQIAAAETKAGLTNTPAQQFTASIDSVFDDMTDEGKRAYIENFLHKDELDAIPDPVQREERTQALLTSDTLRSEMTADFLGNRATDKRFWASVAKADPQGFKGFVDKWVGIIDNLLNTLRGKGNQKSKESAKVDQYIRDLNKAKMVARDALVAYRNGTLQQLAPTPTAPALSAVQGERNAGIAITPGGQGLPGLAAEAGRAPGADRGGEVPSYGTARQGAVSVVGRHYSTAARQSLSGAFYGRGLKGAERNRLDSSPDPRLKNRIYFYVDQGAGIRPEAGVGGVAHEVRLDNIYDPQTRLVKPQADANAFESAVINAGFDGYIAPFGNNQAAVVLLGMKHKAVPVKAIGAVPSAAPAAPATPSTLKKGLMSRELNAIDTSRVPGAQVRMGNLEVPADQVEAANAELARIGSEARFARKQKTQTVGDFEVATEKDGSIKVMGDAEEIRGLMPEGVVGRPVSGGVVFTTSSAPRVRAALEGRRIAYSRGGAVLERLPVKDGKYLGAPEKFNTPAKIPTLRRWLRQLADEGGPGRYWYENSGKEVLKMVGGDVQEARKFVALLAIYSPQAKVDANSTFALRAWAQYRNGRPISVKTGVMDEKARHALEDVDKFWSGEKTGNFFFNLLREIDPSTAGKQGATIDMWMMRAGQYDTDAPTATQYAFMENETNRLAKELGWEPQQVQAAIWVAMKARMENTGVKKATEASSEKKGWIKFERDEKGKKVRVILDAQKHRDNWLKHSFDHDPTKDDTQQAKFDFGDGLKRHLGQVSFEARPGRSTGVLPGIHDAPYAQQVEFQEAVQAAFLDADGNDRLAQLLGLLVDTQNILAPGVWQGEVSPSSQKLVAMAPAKGDEGKTKVDPAQAEALNLYAAVAGLVARQEGVGWHRAFFAGTKRDSNGLDINLGRVINPAEAKDLERAVGEWMESNGKTGWQDSFAFISSPNGVRIVSFGIIDNPQLHTDIVKVAESVLPDFDYRVFASDGDMPTNNWKENPNGESYVQRLSAAGRSDVLDWARTVLAPRVQRVFDDYSEKYGWGNPGTVSFSKRQAAAEQPGDLESVFDGLNKRGLAKTRAEAALRERPDAAQIRFVQDNFLDILEQLDDSGLVEINCD